MDKQIHKVKEITKVTGEQQANRLLKAGWILLETLPQKEGNDSWIEYSLGWTKELPAAR